MYSIGLSTCGKEICDDLFAKYQQAGISDVELSEDFRNFKIADYKRMHDLAKKYGINLWSIHLPFYPFDEIDLSSPQYAKHTVECLSEIIKGGSDIGIKTCIVHASAPFEDASETDMRMECAKDSLAKLAEVADRCGCTIAVENLPANTLPKDSAAIKELLTASDSLRVCFDTNHLLAGEDFPEFLRNIGDKLVTLHVSDYDYINERHWMPGEGKIDWQKMLGILKDINYSGSWMYEIVFRTEPTINRDRYLVCEDFVRNAKELFENKPLTILGTPKEGLTF